MRDPLISAPPDILRWSPRSDCGHGDCAIAAISLACGVTYEIALSAALGVCPNPLEGMTATRICNAIKLLGFTAKKRSKFDLDEDSGILWVEDGERDAHVVYLWEGRILEPESYMRQLWLSPENFLRHYRYTAKWLITAEGNQ